MSESTYFKEIFSYLPKDLETVIVVTHLVPGVDDFLIELNQKLRVAAVIPKPNSIDQRVLKRVEAVIPIIRYTRKDIISRPMTFISEIDAAVLNGRFAIIDTGGYFSHVLFDFPPSLQLLLCGIVEDTENGHQKYAKLLGERALSSFPCPVISVARSQLKEPEDYLVGQAVAFSADALLRERGVIISSKKALVFGYGKIGSSLAHNLRLRGAQVTVIDINPVRQTLALAHGFPPLVKEEALESHDLIFGATGNKSICSDDIYLMKEGAFVFTTTSGDDEIRDYDLLLTDLQPTDHPRIRKFVGKNIVYICNDGNSANFMHGGVVGPFIKLVQAELAYALSHLKELPQNRIFELSNISKEFIAVAWLTKYSKC